MNLHQFRSAQEAVAHGLNLTRAAEQLNASQPGITCSCSSASSTSCSSCATGDISAG